MPVTPHRPTALFAYGTLQPGRRRWPFVARFAIRHRPAAVPGVVFDSGFGWPVATFAGDTADASADRIPGTLVELDTERIDEALTLLDAVEATATNLLRRVVVTTDDGTQAWAYDCPAPPAGAVVIERWDRADER